MNVIQKMISKAIVKHNGFADSTKIYNYTSKRSYELKGISERSDALRNLINITLSQDSTGENALFERVEEQKWTLTKLNPFYDDNFAFPKLPGAKKNNRMTRRSTRLMQDGEEDEEEDLKEEDFMDNDDEQMDLALEAKETLLTSGNSNSSNGASLLNTEEKEPALVKQEQENENEEENNENENENENEAEAETSETSSKAKVKPGKRRKRGSNVAKKNDPKKGSKDPPALTQLQVLMAEAIHKKGGKATFQEMHKHVHQFWGTLRRRNGSKYTADAKRAIKASLANNPTSYPIFIKFGKKNGERLWGNAERAIQALKNAGKFSEELALQARDNDNEPVNEGDALDSDVEEKEDGSPAPSFMDDMRHLEDESSSVGLGSTSNSREGEGEGEEQGEEKDESLHSSVEEKEESNPEALLQKLTPLQRLIRDAIIEHGGHASLETIVEEVKKKWSTLKKRDGTQLTTEPYRSVKASLSNNNPSTGKIFEKVGEEWKLVPAFAENSPASKTPPMATPPTALPTLPSKNPLRLSNLNKSLLEEQKYNLLQALVVRVISEHGGSCSKEVIEQAISNNWKAIKQFDEAGVVTALYSDDPIKAVSACLSDDNTYTPNGLPSPLFKKERSFADAWKIGNTSLKKLILQEWVDKYASTFDFKLFSAGEGIKRQREDSNTPQTDFESTKKRKK